MLDNNAICYQGIQRVFRNAMVGFIRERLPRAFPNDHLQQMKRLFGESWTKAATNATQSRETGGTATTIRDDYDLLGVNHFFEIFDRFFDKIFSANGGHPSTQPRPVKSKLLGNLKQMKDCRDPLSHPVEEEVPYDEAFGLLVDAKQILDALGLSVEAAELAKLRDSLAGGPTAGASALRQLPPQDSIYMEFVGRTGLLEQVKSHFDQLDNRRCLLAGDGGKGKSAVAYRYAQQLADAPGRFQLIVWLSAKRRRFQEGKVVSIDSPDFSTVDDAVNRLLSEYGAVTDDFSKPFEERKRLLLDYLNSYPAFIVGDDIDTLLEDSDVVSLFTYEIPHTQSAVLLTSRRDIPGVRSYVVKGFEKDEAESFIRSRVHLYGLDGQQFTPQVISELVKVTDGSPLYMDDLLRLTRIVDVKKALSTWAERRGDEARKYALQREMERLSQDGKKILVAAAVTDGPISYAELESILEMSEDRLLSALSELQTLFLFPKPKVIEAEQRFDINLNTKKLVRLVEGQSDFYARIERASKMLRGQMPEVASGMVGALIRQAQLRLNADRYQESEQILLEALEKYPQAPDLHSFLGYVYKRMGRLADARTQFESAAKLKSGRRDMYLQWVGMEIGEKEWSRAISVADRAIKVFPDFYEVMERKIFAKKQAGFDFHRGMHREKAEKMWREAADDAKAYIKSPEALSGGERAISSAIYCAAVICLDMLGDTRERNRWLEDWEAEHPGDPQVERQRQILIQKHGSFLIPAPRGRGARV
ncbi:MAG: tetratricopeptide repeat protein [Acidobacteria bacterium]|nr:tetratricopeptide repeat protein [Acidobacteriota bacterium]